MACLGILLADPNALPRAIRYAKAANDQGILVQVFITFDAVSTVANPVIESLTQVAEVWACAQTVQSYGLRARPGIQMGSQFDHADIAARADRFLALTRETS